MLGLTILRREDILLDGDEGYENTESAVKSGLTIVAFRKEDRFESVVET